ncbi:NACHT N-terminal Helical domain 1-containing protein [Streptomyces sp. NBC_00358]|uniref:NACHT N-terminal Helical domain 1-containing protein n=1 Tax=Streptomyces sp. NBC_00358 TaxID=2975725 RepID=UPI003FA6F9DD
MAAVQDTFAAAGPIDAEPLCVADLDPGRLTDELRRPVADRAERAPGLYKELLPLYCAHPVEQLTAHPTYVAGAAVEHTRRTGTLPRERPATGPPDPTGGPTAAHRSRRGGLEPASLAGA